MNFYQKRILVLVSAAFHLQLTVYKMASKRGEGRTVECTRGPLQARCSGQGSSCVFLCEINATKTQFSDYLSVILGHYYSISKETTYSHLCACWRPPVFDANVCVEKPKLGRLIF